MSLNHAGERLCQEEEEESVRSRPNRQQQQSPPTTSTQSCYSVAGPALLLLLFIFDFLAIRQHVKHVCIRCLCQARRRHQEKQTNSDSKYRRKLKAHRHPTPTLCTKSTADEMRQGGSDAGLAKNIKHQPLSSSTKVCPPTTH